MNSFFQESGRAGRDWKLATSTLYFNKNDIMVQILKKCNPLRKISAKPPEICAGETFCLTALVLAFWREMQLFCQLTFVEMTVSSPILCVELTQLFWPLKIFTSLIGTLETCFSLEIRWKKLSQSLQEIMKKLRPVITVCIYQSMCSG